jgi:GNAT superfamily N-acetyltransferase
MGLLFSMLTEESLYSRYIGYSRPRREEIRAILEGEGTREIILVALPVGTENEIVAQTRCIFLDPPTSAELGIVVRDDWQNRGLGTALLKTILNCASQAGVERIVGVIGLSNDRMIHVFDKLGFTTRNRHYDSVEMNLVLSSEKK